MALYSIYAIVFLVTGIITIGFTIFAFIRSLLLVFNWVNVLFIVGAFLLLISYSVAFVLGGIDENSEVLAQNIISVTNFFICLGLLLIALAVFYVRRDFFEFSSIILAFLTGALCVTVTEPKSFKMSYNPRLKFWETNYTPKASVELSAILLILITFFAFYLAKKIVYAVKKHKSYLTIIGLFVIVLWLITIAIPTLYYYRIFFLPLALALIGIDNFKNPLSLLVATYSPNEVILFTKTNFPLLHYLVKSKKIVTDLSELSLLRVSEMLLNEKTSSNSLYNIFRGQQGEVLTIKTKDFIATIVGRRIDHNIKTAIILALKIFSKRVDLKALSTSNILKKDEEEWFKVCLERHLALVCADI